MFKIISKKPILLRYKRMSKAKNSIKPKKRYKFVENPFPFENRQEVNKKAVLTKNEQKSADILKLIPNLS